MKHKRSENVNSAILELVTILEGSLLAETQVLSFSSLIGLEFVT